VEVVEGHGEAGGLRVFWRESGRDGERAPILYLHGVPTGSWDWIPFLERTGGIAPDLPGFGKSAKPGDFDYSIEGYGRFLEAFCEAVGLERFSLVLHDWGAVGLHFAQRFPDRIRRLVLFNCVPFLPGYRWHWIARVWRRRVLGELFMGATTRFGFKQLSKQATTRPGPLPDEFLDAFWPHFDHGTQRAILRLYRSAPEPVLAAAGERLGSITCPALVLWSTEDPYIGAEFGQRHADALGGEVILEVVEAGHWPWIDRPEVTGRAADFLVG
jgi:pimeloyl-ACP methyl ester carboxylesterase